jgi:hypothetical protein
MILVCGGLADGVTELVCARLNACGYPFRLLDLGVYPQGFEVNWRWQDGGPSGYIRSPQWTLDLAELTGVYARYPGPDGRLPLSGLKPDEVATMYSEHDSGISALVDGLQCAVINRTGGGMSNNSKPYQALTIRQCGLLIPPTLVTNEPEDARAFYDEHNGEVVYKSISGIRSIVRRMEPSQLQRLHLLANSPAQFQVFIPGDNIRVHTVGTRLFATRVRSEAVDYRYAHRDGFRVEMEAATLPPPVVASCLKLARTLDLLVTGIDLKETSEGEYYCFEINPSPGFLYYEQNSRQPISLAIADLLYSGKAEQVHAGRYMRTP